MRIDNLFEYYKKQIAGKDGNEAKDRPKVKKNPCKPPREKKIVTKNINRITKKTKTFKKKPAARKQQKNHNKKKIKVKSTKQKKPKVKRSKKNNFEFIDNVIG